MDLSKVANEISIAQIASSQAFNVAELTSTGVGIGGGEFHRRARGGDDPELDRADRSARR